jgi:hypothetical protein
MQLRGRSTGEPPGTAGLRVAAVALVTLVAATGCSSHNASAPTPSLSTPPPSTSAPAPSAQHSTQPTNAGPVLPAGCSQLLPLQAVQDALGVGVVGKVTYLKAAPVPQSGRTGRVTCGYGAPGGTGSASPSGAAPSGAPLVQVSYITYTDAATAAGRVTLTVQHDGQSATISKATVDGAPAWVLVGKVWDELVMADGARTIVVEVSPSILSPEKAPVALTAMATTMLKFAKSADSSGPGGSGQPSASPTATSS